MDAPRAEARLSRYFVDHVELAKIAFMNSAMPAPGEDGGLLPTEALVLCANNSFDGVRLADVHMAVALSKLIHVLYVDPPTSHVAALKQGRLAEFIRTARLRQITPTLSRLTPVSLPGMERRGVAAVTGVLTRAQIRRSLATLGWRSVARIGCSAIVNVFEPQESDLKVFWAQDDYVGGARLMGLSPERVERGERAVALDADMLITSSPVVDDIWRRRGFESRLIPFGADVDAFASVERALKAPDVHLRRPTATFIGHINDRIDMSLLTAVVDGGLSLLLVGPCESGFAAQLRSLLDRPNVQWVGRKPSETLPSYMQVTDVALVPYADSAFNRGSFPLKTLEYLSGGLPVVATPLPSVVWLNSELITLASMPQEFAAAARRQAMLRNDAAIVAARREFAQRHSWRARAEQLLEAIRVAVPQIREDRSRGSET